MRPRLPVYRGPSGCWQADACLPLVAAATARKVRFEALVHGHYPGQSLPAHFLRGIKSVGFWEAEHEQDWGLPWHRNEGIELTFLNWGKLGFAVDHREYELHPEALTITRPWQRHRVGLPAVGAGRLHWLILDVGVRSPDQPWRWPEWVVLSPEDKAELTRYILHNEDPVRRATPEIRNCFLQITQALRRGTSELALSELAVYVNELLLSLLRLFRLGESRRRDCSSASLETVELLLKTLRSEPQHLEHEWSVEEMAQKCGLGPTQFTEYVKRITNMTPLEFLRECRLEYAAQLLREQINATVLEVAMAAGFCSSQHFATAFARRFGCTPTEWRRSRLRHSQSPSAEDFPDPCGPTGAK